MNTRKIVVNAIHGGFGLSWRATERYEELSGNVVPYAYDIKRDDPHLVQVIEEMGARANGEFSSLVIVEIPADVDWEIDEYDGLEWVAEAHRRWYP